MANDLNQCSFIGRLGKDPEIRFLPAGGQVTSFSIACGSTWTDKNTNQKQEKTDWVPVVMFGKLAEIAGQYLKKGAKVFIQGSFKTRKWQDQSGQDRYTTEIVLDGFTGTMQMLDSQGQQQTGHQQTGHQQVQQAQPQQQYQQPVQQQAQQPVQQPYQQPDYSRPSAAVQQSPMAGNPNSQQYAQQQAQNYQDNVPQGANDFSDDIPF